MSYSKKVYTVADWEERMQQHRNKRNPGPATEKQKRDAQKYPEIDPLLRAYNLSGSTSRKKIREIKLNRKLTEWRSK